MRKETRQFLASPYMVLFLFGLIPWYGYPSDQRIASIDIRHGYIYSRERCPPFCLSILAILYRMRRERERRESSSQDTDTFQVLSHVYTTHIDEPAASIDTKRLEKNSLYHVALSLHKVHQTVH